MPETEERIAVLESEYRALTREMAKTEARLDEKVDSLLRKVDEISAKMNRQRGFWAGVTFLASVIGFMLSQVWQYLASRS